jgi:hypothetical protein
MWKLNWWKEEEQLTELESRTTDAVSPAADEPFPEV